jgi:hypothetical protein
LYSGDFVKAILKGLRELSALGALALVKRQSAFCKQKNKTHPQVPGK